jgi:hypothetical protein
MGHGAKRMALEKFATPSLFATGQEKTNIITHFAYDGDLDEDPKN